MPIYEYRCGDCDKKFEVFTPQRMSMDGVVCNTCHGSNVRRLVSVFASTGGDGDGDMSFGESGESAASGGGCCGGSCGCGCGH